MIIRKLLFCFIYLIILCCSGGDNTEENNDLDSDGVINSIDLCPSTPLGFEVDETGCSLRIDPSQLVEGKFPIHCFQPYVNEAGQYFSSQNTDRNIGEDFGALTRGITSSSSNRVKSSIVNTFTDVGVIIIDSSAPRDHPTYYHIKNETFDRLGFPPLFF